jgi:hypothetical protein
MDDYACALTPRYKENCAADFDADYVKHTHDHIDDSTTSYTLIIQLAIG